MPKTLTQLVADYETATKAGQTQAFLDQLENGEFQPRNLGEAIIAQSVVDQARRNLADPEYPPRGFNRNNWRTRQD